MRLALTAPLLLVVLVVVAQFAPVLVGRVYRFEDIAGYFEPLWAASARAMKAGRWPIWDGGAWSGQPIVGDPQAGVFYPLNWLWLALPVLRAYAVAATLHALIAGTGMYALVRVRGGSRAAAALGGVALGVGGYLVLQVRHIMFVEATAWMPWVVAAGWRAVETRRPVHIAGLALSTGMLLLTGGVSMIYYGAWFAAAVLSPHALGARIAMQHKLRCVAALVMGGVVGLLLAAPSIVPAAAHGALSPRALGADEHFAASVSWGGLHFLPSLFIPNLLGQDVRGNYMGGGTQWEIAAYYTGMLTFALGLFALFAGARQRRAERIALGLVMVLCVLLAPGEHSPVHHLACRILPMYSTMRCPPRALYVVALAMPMLAADGLDLLIARLGRRPLLQRNIAIAIPLLVALDLLVTHRAENPTVTLAAAHKQAFPDVVDFLRANLKPGERYVNDVHLRHDLHNSGLLWDLPNASGYSSLPLWRYLHLLWISNHGKAYPHAKLHDDLAAQGIWNFDSPIVDLLGVRYVLTPKTWDPEGRRYLKRFDGSDGIDVWENTRAMSLVFCGNEASLGKVTAAEMADWVKRDEELRRRGRYALSGRCPASIACHAGGDAQARIRDLSATSIEVETSIGCATVLVLSLPAHPGWRATIDGAPAEIDTTDYALTGVWLPPQHQRGPYASPGESQAYDPVLSGWEPMFTVDLVQREYAPHVVRLEMTSRPVEVGLKLAALGALCVAAMTLLELWRRRREAAL